MRPTLRACLASLALLAACSGAPVAVRTSPTEALSVAMTRLTERGITLDATGRATDAFRTERYCYVPPDAQGNDWARSFTSPYSGLLVLTVDGDEEAQKVARAKCERLFRVELRATTDAAGQTRLQATGEWWRKVQRRCEVVGNPLVGQMRCDYGYDGAVAPQAVEPYIHAMLTGL